MYIAEQKNKSIFKTYLIYFICMALFCVVRIAASYGWLSDIDVRYADIISTLIIQGVLMFALPLLLYCLLLKVKPKAVFKTCNYNKLNIQTVIISLGLGILVFFINLIVSGIFNGIITFTGYSTPIFLGGSAEVSYSAIYFFLDVILIAVLPALCEEFLHRGILLQGTKHTGFSRAIIISSVLFGFAHFDINKVAYAIVLGLIMGFVSVVAKNIWVPIIIHFTNNFIATYLDYASVNGWVGKNFYNLLNGLQNQNILTIFIICCVGLLIIVGIMTYFVIQLFKQTILRSVNKAITSVYSSNDADKRGEPIVVEQNRMIQEMLETNTMLNLNYEAMKSPIEIVMPKQKHIYKPTHKDNIFLIASYVLGGLVTLFTFVWGFL